MKTVVLERDVEGSGQHRVHAGFPDYAKHGGFVIQRCRPDRARTQGAWPACRATAPGSPSRRDDSVTPFASYLRFRLATTLDRTQSRDHPESHQCE